EFRRVLFRSTEVPASVALPWLYLAGGSTAVGRPVRSLVQHRASAQQAALRDTGATPQRRGCGAAGTAQVGIGAGQTEYAVTLGYAPRQKLRACWADDVEPGKRAANESRGLVCKQ